MLLSGTLLHGRYRIEKALQEGGMSVVYRAHDASVDCTVAIKEMKDPFSEEGERRRAVEEFHKEAKILANLHHEGLPRVTHFFEFQNNYYVVMDFIDGETLDYAATHYDNIVPEAVCLDWAWQICAVLKYLHSRHPPIIFRDLKPANVMVTPDGHIKLIDFGIAKIFEPEIRTHTLIRGAGTPGFAPPEQYGQLGRSHTDARTDIYGLGATLYTLSQGKIPTEATTRFMQDEPLEPMRHLRPETIAIFLQCLELTPETRFQSVVLLMDAIAALPSLALKASPTRRPEPQAAVMVKVVETTHPPEAPPADAAAPAVALPAVVAPWSQRPTRPARQGPHWGIVLGIVAVGIAIGSQLAPHSGGGGGGTPSPSPTPSAVAVATATPAPTSTPVPTLMTPTLHLESSPPGVEIVVDNHASAPYVVGSGGFSLPLPAGHHTITASRAGYLPQTMEADVSDTTVSTLQIQLQKASVLRINSRPEGMTVKVDGREAGVTPVELKELRDGDYTLTLYRPGYTTYERKIHIGPGETMVLDAVATRLLHPQATPTQTSVPPVSTSTPEWRPTPATRIPTREWTRTPDGPRATPW